MASSDDINSHNDEDDSYHDSDSSSSSDEDHEEEEEEEKRPLGKVKPAPMSMGKSMSSELNFSKGTTAKGTEGFELEEIVKIFANNLQ